MPGDWQESSDSFDTSDASTQFDSSPTLSDTGIRAMQGEPPESPIIDQPPPPEPPQPPQPEPPQPPPGEIPTGAHGEKGDASRAETGAEKTEVEIHRGGIEKGY